MLADYQDIRRLIEREPLWWDVHGVPRYLPHSPKLASDIYCDEVALLTVACQSCRQEFKVQITHKRLSAAAYAWAKQVPEGPAQQERFALITSGLLAHEVRTKEIHYGDPPRHDNGGHCSSGDTMNVIDLRVEEFWTRLGGGDGEWRRIPELEVQIESLDDY